MLIIVAAQDYGIRLVNGPDEFSGRVEIKYHGVWGTVCDKKWNINDAKVVCRQLNYKVSSLTPSGLRSAAFGPGTGRIWLNNVECDGSEPALFMCKASSQGTHVDECDHSMDASVICEGSPTTVEITPSHLGPIREMTYLSPIECVAKCSISCLALWYKGNVSTGNYLNQTDGLSFGPNISRSDAGNYTCMANGVTNQIEIKVIYGPDAVKLSRTGFFGHILVIEGNDTETVTCSADCYPECKVRWFYRNSTDQVALIPTQHGVLSNLSVNNRTHVGKYICVGTNPITNKTYTSSSLNILVVYGPDTIGFSPKQNASEIFVMEGEDVDEIKCLAVCYPFCKIIRYKGSPIDGVLKYIGTGILNLSNVTSMTTGSYSCMAENAVSNKTVHSQTIQVSVIYGPYDLRLFPLNSEMLQTGDNFTGVCTAQCFPFCSYKWFHSDKHPSNNLVSNSSLLSLTNINRTDAGDYVCQVVNPHSYKTVYSKTLSVTVSYGPDKVVVFPDPIMNDDTTVSCTADCYPLCDKYWVSDMAAMPYNGSILHLTLFNRTQNHTVTCKAVNPYSKLERSKTILVSQKAKQRCTDTQFDCANVTCIALAWKCDGQIDCHSKADEINCNSTTCDSDHFYCGENVCIPKRWECDGDTDCQDGLDENNCTESCGVRDFQCRTGGKCISHTYKCDQEEDCDDGSDEDQHLCKNSNNTLCAANEFQCKNGECIMYHWQCDGENDCPDNSDELQEICQVQSTLVAEGHDIEPVKCSSSCQPPCFVKWYKDVIDGNNNTKFQNGVLYIQTIRRSDAGVYTCVMENPQSASKIIAKKVNISVSYGPGPLQINPANLNTVTEGNDAPLVTCSADCYPNCTTTWYKGPILDIYIVPSLNGILNLTNIQRHDSGLYNCIVRNSFMNRVEISYVDINVNYGPTVVNITQTAVIVFPGSGYLKHINCTTDCNPACQILWYINTDIIHDTNGVLNLNKLKLKQDTLFHCVAVNPTTNSTLSSKTLTVSVQNYTKSNNSVQRAAPKPDNRHDDTSSHVLPLAIGVTVAVLVVVIVIIVVVVVVVRRSRPYNRLEVPILSKDNSQMLELVSSNNSVVTTSDESP